MSTTPRTGSLAPLKKFARFDAEKRKIKDRLKVIASEMDALQEPIQQMMEQMEMSAAKVGDVTVYLKRETWVGKANDSVSGDQIADALKACDLAGFIKSETMNHQSFSAYLRELLKNHGAAEPSDLRELLPLEIRALIKVSDKFVVSTRKS